METFQLGRLVYLGIFFMGFGVASLILAFWFAPTKYKGHMLAATLIALGEMGLIQDDEVLRYEKFADSIERN